jgi:hypothetical protein
MVSAVASYGMNNYEGEKIGKTYQETYIYVAM